jgi:hypothetical protein
MKTETVKLLEGRETVADRRASRYAVHDALLLDLHRKFPTQGGSGISFGKAFRADAALKSRLGVRTEKDMHTLDQHARRLVRGEAVVHRRGKYKKHKKRVLPVPPVHQAPEAPQFAMNYCYHCQAPLRPLNHALALFQKLS